ncbi:hypothetical protein DIPPA_20060 [Diplonema papillatum]|nr:hypothetical protein DIPPA_20060 [Diplonema papillatum]
MAEEGASDENPSSDQQPGTEQGKPGTEADKPGTEQGKPGTEEDTPGTEQVRPATEEDKPGTKQVKPATEEDKPGTQEDTLGTEEKPCGGSSAAAGAQAVPAASSGDGEATRAAAGGDPATPAAEEGEPPAPAPTAAALDRGPAATEPRGAGPGGEGEGENEPDTHPPPTAERQGRGDADPDLDDTRKESAPDESKSQEGGTVPGADAGRSPSSSLADPAAAAVPMPGGADAQEAPVASETAPPTIAPGASAQPVHVSPKDEHLAPSAAAAAASPGCADAQTSESSEQTDRTSPKDESVTATAAADGAGPGSAVKEKPGNESNPGTPQQQSERQKAADASSSMQSEPLNNGGEDGAGREPAEQTGANSTASVSMAPPLPAEVRGPAAGRAEEDSAAAREPAAEASPDRVAAGETHADAAAAVPSAAAAAGAGGATAPRPEPVRAVPAAEKASSAAPQPDAEPLPAAAPPAAAGGPPAAGGAPAPRRNHSVASGSSDPAAGTGGPSAAEGHPPHAHDGSSYDGDSTNRSHNNDNTNNDNTNNDNSTNNSNYNDICNNSSNTAGASQKAHAAEASAPENSEKLPPSRQQQQQPGGVGYALFEAKPDDEGAAEKHRAAEAEAAPGGGGGSKGERAKRKKQKKKTRKDAAFLAELEADLERRMAEARVLELAKDERREELRREREKERALRHLFLQQTAAAQKPPRSEALRRLEQRADRVAARQRRDVADALKDRRLHCDQLSSKNPFWQADLRRHAEAFDERQQQRRAEHARKTREDLLKLQEETPRYGFHPSFRTATGDEGEALDCDADRKKVDQKKLHTRKEYGRLVSEMYVPTGKAAAHHANHWSCHSAYAVCVRPPADDASRRKMGLDNLRAQKGAKPKDASATPRLPPVAPPAQKDAGRAKGDEYMRQATRFIKPAPPPGQRPESATAARQKVVALSKHAAAKNWDDAALRRLAAGQVPPAETEAALNSLHESNEALISVVRSKVGLLKQISG